MSYSFFWRDRRGEIADAYFDTSAASIVGAKKGPPTGQKGATHELGHDRFVDISFHHCTDTSHVDVDDDPRL
jgi:hypothetical protein